jgi:hypothetical protein
MNNNIIAAAYLTADEAAMAVSTAYRLGVKAGRKEVVEIASELLLPSIYGASPKRLKWQAKLKEWGISDKGEGK